MARVTNSKAISTFPRPSRRKDFYSPSSLVTTASAAVTVREAETEVSSVVFLFDGGEGGAGRGRPRGSGGRVDSGLKWFVQWKDTPFPPRAPLEGWLARNGPPGREGLHPARLSRGWEWRARLLSPHPARKARRAMRGKKAFLLSVPIPSATGTPGAAAAATEVRGRPQGRSSLRCREKCRGGSRSRHFSPGHGPCGRPRATPPRGPAPSPLTRGLAGLGPGAAGVAEHREAEVAQALTNGVRQLHAWAARPRHSHTR